MPSLNSTTNNTNLNLHSTTSTTSKRLKEDISFSFGSKQVTRQKRKKQKTKRTSQTIATI